MILKLIRKEKQKIFIIGVLLLWAAVTLLKYGGQSLIVHYLWPFIAGGALILLFNKKWLKNKVGLLHTFALLGLGLFILSFVFDLTPSDGSLELMNVGFGLILALILSNEDWKEDSLKYLFIGLILVVCIVDVWAIISYAGGHPFNRLAGPLMKPNEAFSGFPNLLANLNLLALLPAFFFFNEIKKKSRLISFSVVLANVIIISSLILTFSRAAWLSAAAIIIIAGIYLFFRYKPKFLLKYVISGAIVLLLSIGMFLGVNYSRGISEDSLSVGDKISFQSEDEGSSVNERIESFKRGFDMALSAPLYGVGAGSFNYVSQSYEQNFSTLSSYPYSLPVKIVAEHGFITFGLIFAWLALLLIFGFREAKNYQVIILLTILILLLHHSIDNNLDFFSASFPLFLLLGIAWPKAKVKSHINNLVVLIVIGVITISGIIFAAFEGYNGLNYIKARNAAGALDHELAYEKYLDSTSLLFNRDARLAAANSAYELNNFSAQNNWLTNALNQASYYNTVDNPLDKRGPLLSAKILIEQKKYPECLEMVDLARKIGGQNDFETDFYELICLEDEEQLQIAKNNVIPKLEAYLELLKVNAHMTVLTDNPKYAIKIAAIIAEQDFEHQGLMGDLYNTAVLELEKFHEQYGIEAEIDI
ncbi:O-antigen ligase family protein [Patescibacteria group bacterium]